MRGRLAGAIEPASTGVALIAITALFAELFTASGSSVLKQVVATALVNLVLVVALYIFSGNSGIFSFGHLAFAAVGAYTVGILTIPPKSVGDVTGKDVLLPALPKAFLHAHAGPTEATLAAGGVAMVVAAVIALPLMRLSGIAASLATFAVLIIEYVVANNWHTITNGTSGYAGVPITTTVSRGLVWAAAAIVVASSSRRAGARGCARRARTRSPPVRSGSASSTSGGSRSCSAPA
jgi:branched-chain amino acid transport system permease protein